MQLWSGGTGAIVVEGAGADAPAEPDDVPPPEVAVPGVATPVPPLPEQKPVTVGLQLKPAPQSLSTLQGSCHLYMHVETFVVVQTSGAGFATAQPVAFGSQAGAVPPEHEASSSV
jgi:hypothetical protein